MNDVNISNDIIYIGADDKDIDLFEGQYIVPNGISYNSYLIKDEKNVVMDTVDKRKSEEWLNNLEDVLNGEELDYLVISHLEPDHSYNIGILAEKYPEMKLVGNAKTFAFLPQFFDIENLEARKVLVEEGSKLNIGKHTLQFFMAPMVHWPEVMVTYEQAEKILFTADGFGKFGTLDTEEDWDCEARRYYFNIVGKYGVQNLGHYINKYDIWSSYKPEDDGVFIAYASIHGNTAEAAKALVKILEEKGAKKVSIADLSRDDMAEAVEDAFRYDKLILAAPSYDAKVFTPMEQFLNILISKNYQKRKVGIIENGTWAPTAARCMKEYLEKMKDIDICDTIVTIKTTVKAETLEKMKLLSEEILKC